MSEELSNLENKLQIEREEVISFLARNTAFNTNNAKAGIRFIEEEAQNQFREQININGIKTKLKDEMKSIFTPTPESTKQLTAFQYASDGEVHAILQAAKNIQEIIFIKKTLNRGNWEELIKWTKEDPERRNLLFAAHAMGVLNALDMATILMFNDTIAKLDRDIKWRIDIEKFSYYQGLIAAPTRKVYDIEEFVGYEFIEDHERITEIKNPFSLKIPGITFFQELIQKKMNRQQWEICPIMHLAPSRKDLLSRLQEENKI